MEPLVDPDDFPASRQSAYLNTASVTLMYRGAETAAAKWMADLATDGTITFDELAEESVFGGLHRATAQLLSHRAKSRTTIQDHDICMHDQRQQESVKYLLFLRHRNGFCSLLPGGSDAGNQRPRDRKLLSAFFFTPPAF